MNILDRLLRRVPEQPTISEQQRFRALSVATPSEYAGWMDAARDGDTTGEPRPHRLTAEQRRALDVRQAAFVARYRNGRCSS